MANLATVACTPWLRLCVAKRSRYTAHVTINLRTPYGGMPQSDASPSTSLITPTTRICVTSTRRLESATESALAGNSDKVPLLYNAQMNVRSSAFSALSDSC